MGRSLVFLLVLGGIGYGAWSYWGPVSAADELASSDPAGAETNPEQHAAVIPPALPGEPDGDAATDQAPHAAEEAPAQAVAPPEPTPAPVTQSDPEALKLITRGRQLVQNNQWVEGRELLNKALVPPGRLTPADAEQVRKDLTTLNNEMVFSLRVIPNDPYVDTYVVQQGDLLSKIARPYGVPWQLLERINKVKASRIRVGQRLKVVKGPFHAVVHKKDFRLDLYLGDLYVRSYKVGLGEYGSTPLGKFKVNSKLENPAWVNPRTGKEYLPDDPANPIGEHWIGLIGDEPDKASLTGYGIHGTIDPGSIGKEKSMGCVRMSDDDVHYVFDALSMNKSKVVILAQ